MFLGAIMLAVWCGSLWGISLVRPKWFGSKMLWGTATPMTNKSKWMREKFRSLSMKVAQRTLWVLVPIALLPLPFYTTLAIVLGYTVAVFGYQVIEMLRLNNKWKLWQQLGYDGPPELEHQSDKLLLSQEEERR
jgi:hypothetical protein